MNSSCLPQRLMRNLEIAGFRTSRALDSDDSGADVDFDIVWDDHLLLGEDVLHLEQRFVVRLEESSRMAQVSGGGLQNIKPTCSSMPRHNFVCAYVSAVSASE